MTGFLYFQVILLYDDSNSLSYEVKLSDSKFDYPFNYSICFQINDVKKTIFNDF